MLRCEQHELEELQEDRLKTVSENWIKPGDLLTGNGFSNDHSYPSSTDVILIVSVEQDEYGFKALVVTSTGSNSVKTICLARSACESVWRKIEL